MNISQSGGSRPEWYDRNPVMQTASYNATIAPAAVTQRCIYTVSAGSKAFAELAYVEQIRGSVAAPVGRATVQATYTKSGGSALPMVRAFTINNTVDVGVTGQANGNTLMLAGDALTGYTEDLSTGGTVSWIITLKATAFDA